MSPFTLWPSASHARKRELVFADVLGRGGYGEVKQAYDTRNNRQVAVKIVDKSHVSDPVAQVARHHLLLSFHHDHIVKLYDWFESRHRYYLVFELAKGGELYDHLVEEGRFGEPEAQDVAKALSDALQYMHERGVCHRDIKLENVLYRTPPGKFADGHAGDCVLSDFGLAIVLATPNEKLHSYCGSPGYSAPEVHSDEGYNQAADMWSFGVLVFALMGGRFPYKETEPLAIAHEARTTPLYFPPSWDLISDKAKDFVSKLLTVDPEQRMSAKEACNHPWLTTAVAVCPPASQEDRQDSLIGAPQDVELLIEKKATFAHSTVNQAVV